MWVAATLAVLAIAFSTVTLVIRTLPLTNIYMLVIAVGAPYVALVATLGVILAVLSRRVVLSLLAVIVLAATLEVQWRWYYVGDSVGPTGEHVELRLMSANLRYGRADAAEFVELARSSADVITVSELTPDAVRRMYAAGIGEEFEYSMLLPAPRASGNGIWSRFPLTALSPTKYWSGTMVAGRIALSGVSSDPIVASVHTTSPIASFTSWKNTMAATKSKMESLAVQAGSGAVLVAGDFNSTPDMSQFRKLLTNGYQDTVDELGSGFAPSFPSSERFPPLITIDHVLVHGATPASVRAVARAGTDHRAILATIKVPAEPAGR